MNWDDVRYFLAVARTGTLAGAARALKVEHSTVGRRLGALEEALGAKLFVKTPDGYVLTDAGREVLAQAEAMEQAAADLARRAQGSDGKLSGTVRLTTSEGFSGFLVKRLGALRARHPDLIVEVLSANQTLDLARGEADVAVRLAPTDGGDLIVKKIGECGWALYGSESYLARAGAPARPDDLGGHDVVGYEDVMARVPGAQWLTRHGRGTRVVLRGNSIVAVLNAVTVGMGLSVLPCFMAAGEATLRRVSPDLLGTRDIWLVFHPDRARIARVRTVIDFVTEAVRAEAELLRGA